MQRFIQSGIYRLRLLSQWHALMVCFAAGAATSLAFAPLYLWWALPFALPAFYYLLDASGTRLNACMRGFMFGYGFFMAGTWWIANALAVDAAQFGWLIPISVVGLSAVMALWFGVFGWLVWWRRTGHAVVDLVQFILLWVAVEYLRTLGMFGFPWNLLGYAALASPKLAQVASLIGSYGLSVCVLALAMLPVALTSHRISALAKAIYTAVAASILILGMIFGAARIPAQSALTEARVRVVQPNIAQAMKWTQQGRLESIRIHGELSRQPSENGAIPSTIIWAETAAPFTFYPDSVWPARLSSMVPAGSTLLTGAVRADDSAPKLQLWNSIVAISPEGKWLTSYDKHQLVPFGEFVPLRSVLPLDKITPGSIDFSRGKGVHTTQVPGVPPFSALVCYEVIFPWLTVDAAQRPAWVLNATNDAWYGDTAGPYQHYATARMRAIEQGLPLVRAANTGISAIIDPYGRAVAQLPLNMRGVIDGALPKALAATPYARYHEIPVLTVMFILYAAAYWRVRCAKN